MLRGFALVLALLAIVAVAYAGGIIDGTLKAWSEGQDIVLTWRSSDETGVTGYLIDRKAGINGPFIRVAEIPAHGSASDYSFRDKSVFRTTGTFYQYRVTIGGGTPVEYYVSIDHSVSSVRRTWGSIKAMFR
jgi:hypothetical protein